jgi:hypothetical protein
MLKEDLKFYTQNRKVNNLWWAIFWSIIACVAIQFLATYAAIGVRAVVLENNLSDLTAGILIAGVSIAYIITEVYIVITTLETILNIFWDDIVEFGKKLKIYLKAGRKALREAQIEQEPKPESEPTATELPTKDGQKSLTPPL